MSAAQYTARGARFCLRGCRCACCGGFPRVATHCRSECPCTRTFLRLPHVSYAYPALSSLNIDVDLGVRMLLFCPTCSNLLHVEDGPSCLRFACKSCPYVSNITRRVSSRVYPKLKEVDDVLGGSAAWENVDSTEERCPKCSHSRAYFMQIQTRSADEPMTTFYKCCNPQCGHNWRE